MILSREWRQTHGKRKHAWKSGVCYELIASIYKEFLQFNNTKNPVLPWSDKMSRQNFKGNIQADNNTDGKKIPQVPHQHHHQQKQQTDQRLMLQWWGEAKKSPKGIPHLSVVRCKGSQVGDNPWGDEDISRQVDVQMPKLQRGVAPSGFLTSQAPDQLLCAF